MVLLPEYAIFRGELIKTDEFEYAPLHIWVKRIAPEAQHVCGRNPEYTTLSAKRQVSEFKF